MRIFICQCYFGRLLELPFEIDAKIDDLVLEDVGQGFWIRDYAFNELFVIG